MNHYNVGKSKTSSYFDYWGKANRSLNHVTGSAYHLLPYHSLDVAAVGSVLCKKDSAYLSHFLNMTGLDKQTFIEWNTLLLALHDIGKFASSFQSLNPNTFQILQSRQSNHQYSAVRHDSLGFILWNKHLRKVFQEHQIIPQATNKMSKMARGRVDSHSIDLWIGSMVGHHGQPPNASTNRVLSDDFDERDLIAASEFLEDLLPLFISNHKVFKIANDSLVQYKMSLKEALISNMK